MSEQILTERQLRSLKRHAKQRARKDKNLTYMQHLDAVSADLHGCRFEEAKALSETRVPQVHSPMSLYMQACQDAYFDL